MVYSLRLMVKGVCKYGKIIIVLQALFFYYGINSHAQTAEELITQVKAKIEKVNDYEASGEMKTNVVFIKAPVTRVKIYFKKPDKLRIKNETGISFIPKGSVNINIGNIFSTSGNYDIIDVGKESGTGLRIIKLLPRDENSDVVLSTLYIDEKQLLVKKSKTTTKENGTYELEMGLRSALANNELMLHYQPIFDTKTGKIAICEALMRWDHPTLGRISPAEFIPIAESCSMIEPITAWALERACQDAMEWDENVRVAVNISPALIKSDGLPRAVIAALMLSGLKARRLELEVTESIFLEDSGRTNLILSDLQRIGLRLALDDFGTGYSSLGYLRDYAFDTIKVDQSFMRGVDGNSRHRAIVQSVAYLAHSLNVETVAEGIETDDQLRCAREMGFTNVQGFVLSRPISAAQVLRMMQSMDSERGSIAMLQDRRRA